MPSPARPGHQRWSECVTARRASCSCCPGRCSSPASSTRRSCRPGAGRPPTSWRPASAHRAAWFASTWLITLSIVAGLAAVELLAPDPRHGPGPGRPVAVHSGQRAGPRLNHLRPGRDQHPARARPACPAGISASSTGPTDSAPRTSLYWHRPRWAVSPRRSCAPECYPDGRDTSSWPRRSCCWASTPHSVAHCRSRNFSRSSPSASAALAHRAPTALPPQAIVGIPGPDKLSARHYIGGADDQPSQL